jgi:hypothetical protein
VGTNFRRLLFVVALFGYSLPASARDNTDSELLKNVANDATLVASIELASLESLTRSMFRPFGIAAAVLLEQGAKAALGWSPFSEIGWREIGVTGPHVYVDVTAPGRRDSMRIRVLVRGDRARLSMAIREAPNARIKSLGGDRFALIFESRASKKGDGIPGSVPADVQAFLAGTGIQIWVRDAGQPQPSKKADCHIAERLVKSGPFSRVMLSLKKESGRVRLVATFIPRDATLKTSLTTSSTAPRWPKSARAGIISAIATPAALATLARPKGLARLEDFRAVRKHCGGQTTVTTLLYGWPLVAGLYLDELKKLGPDAERLLMSIGGFVLAVKETHADPSAFIGAAVIATAGAKPLVEYVFGPSVHVGRDAAEYGKGPLRARVEAARVVLGLGKDALPWFLKSELAPPRKRIPLVELFWKRAQALTWLWQRVEAPLIDRFLQGFGESRAELVWNEPHLILSLSLSES